MWRHYREPIGSSDPGPEPRTTPIRGLPDRLCPYSVYEYPCGKSDCAGCPIRIEAGAKANEDREIAENMKSYWANLNAGSER